MPQERSDPFLVLVRSGVSIVERTFPGCHLEMNVAVDVRHGNEFISEGAHTMVIPEGATFVPECGDKVQAVIIDDYYHDESVVATPVRRLVFVGRRPD